MLKAHEPAPYDWENFKSDVPIIIACDHASNRIPEALGTLGLSYVDLQKHIAVDIGTRTIGRYLARALDAAVIFANYSRLVIDVNRGLDHRTSIAEVSDHVIVPGNVNLTLAEKQTRAELFYHPYHNSLTHKIEGFLKKGVAPVFLSIHSCTPVMDGFERPWEMGVLWHKDGRISQPLIKALQKNNPQMTIGDNQPYSIPDDPTYSHSVARHALRYGLPYTCIEFRQDLVADEESAERMAKIYLESLKPFLDDADLYTPFFEAA